MMSQPHGTNTEIEIEDMTKNTNKKTKYLEYNISK